MGPSRESIGRQGGLRFPPPYPSPRVRGEGRLSPSPRVWGKSRLSPSPPRVGKEQVVSLSLAQGEGWGEGQRAGAGFASAGMKKTSTFAKMMMPARK
jgi:hypothetical protein